MSLLQEPDFDIAATVQSQYADSPNLRAIIDAFWAAMNPDADLESLYNNMINVLTAQGFGLDVWGRIVAVGRSLLALDEESPYFGFQPVQGVTMGRVRGFNNAPFYAPATRTYRLEDEAYRAFVLIKAMVNISDSSLASINSIVQAMFPDEDIMVQHSGTMALRLTLRTTLTPAQKAALFALPWAPAGVMVDVYEVITPTFGFDGSRLHPFNNGTFSTYTPMSIEDYMNSH